MEQIKTTASPWSFMKKLGFRFFFLFFVQYIFFNPNGVLPYVDVAYDYYIRPFHNLIPWIGKNILHLSYDISVFTNGSGDTTYDYVVLLFLTVMAIIGAILWTLIDNKRKSYNTLYYWLTAVMRYYLAFTMLAYGSYKVFKLQFPFFSPNSLLEPYGNSSPMGLAWNFMGYSKGYNYFTGFGEVISGLLLLFRRTTTLGAIITLAVAGNVMAINYCFDVPVKLLSSMLVVMSLFIMWKDMQRLLDFFIRNRPVVPASLVTPKFKKKWLNISLIAFKFLIIGYILYADISGGIEGLKNYGDDAVKPPLYGIYNVESFIRNKDTISPLATDTARWDKMIVSWPGYVTVNMMNDSAKGFAFQPDTTTKKIVMYKYSDTAKKWTFNYSFPERNILLMEGKWKDDSVLIRMKQYDLNNFLLVNRGFHWINEYPFNR